MAEFMKMRETSYENCYSLLNHIGFVCVDSNYLPWQRQSQHPHISTGKIAPAQDSETIDDIGYP